MTYPAPLSGSAQDETRELRPKFDAHGLVAAIAQDADTGEVLMLAWMNAEALEQTLATGRAELPLEPAKPAVPVKKSMTADYLICLEDGKRFKSLKRHLRTQYSMTPEQYRDKWGLPPDYPMVAPNYAVARSQLAKKMGLGQQRRRRK